MVRTLKVFSARLSLREPSGRTASHSSPPQALRHGRKEGATKRFPDKASTSNQGRALGVGEESSLPSVG